MNIVRVATYNIHKGVQGIGPQRRLEIHNLGHAVEQLDADIVCLQEVRLNRREEQHFTRWPELPQAEFLAPEGYEAVYRTNAFTRHGEHGNAMLSRWPVVAHQQEEFRITVLNSVVCCMSRSWCMAEPCMWWWCTWG